MTENAAYSLTTARKSTYGGGKNSHWRALFLASLAALIAGATTGNTLI